MFIYFPKDEFDKMYISKTLVWSISGLHFMKTIPSGSVGLFIIDNRCNATTIQYKIMAGKKFGGFSESISICQNILSQILVYSQIPTW